MQCEIVPDVLHTTIVVPPAVAIPGEAQTTPEGERIPGPRRLIALTETSVEDGFFRASVNAASAESKFADWTDSAFVWDVKRPNAKMPVVRAMMSATTMRTIIEITGLIAFLRAFFLTFPEFTTKPRRRLLGLLRPSYR